MLLTEKQFIDAAKRNDTEAMKTLGRGLNANAKNVVNPPEKPWIIFFAKASVQ